MATRRKTKAPSPILGVAAGLIDDASNSFVRQDGKFRHTFEVPLTEVTPDPDQPRKHFDDESIAALAETMVAEGQLQPILVRRITGSPSNKRWVIVAGERRWRAAQHAGWSNMLAIEHDGDAEVAALIENLQRVDLNPLEEATGIQRLIEKRGWNQSQASEVLGKSRGEISSILKILTLPAEILEELTSERGVARNTLVELARVPDPVRQQELIEQARTGQLTVKAIRLGRADLERTDSAPTRKPSGFTFTSVDRMAQRLSEVRAQQLPLNSEDRERLRRLRAEIDQVLGDENT
ncbi:ParB/RepB/Spo0J family partition protein (plasmid) [Komagataeibacter sucrofermentans]|uniref:Chromosome partitioning protein ParB n=1 Tax=Komagataeibacter sucrofermentans TaxID=1053551 RepID=A0A318QLR9_9PROT|nr:ParB/RepB/Spo0J family partition protein [Komagataeibacter sucrofermentans]PYD78222.1 chromosome partitioning protein ParB [Komagataeibacter sucrofermentans]GBQ51649.1 chromosome partitioning nuclease protein [Komagataeibacter sucrofermentans DSM 15973]